MRPPHLSISLYLILPRPKDKNPTDSRKLPRAAVSSYPALFSPDSATAQRVLEFFTANIRNPHTRKAYATAVRGAGPRVDRGA